jgi:hypothetical protein
MNSVAWGSVFLDAENDGDLDIYVSAEHDGTVSGYLSSALFTNNNDEYILENEAIPDDYAISYSNAIGDIDNDGYPEILVNNINHDNIFLWKNNSNNTNNWLKVKLEGTISNRNGVGSMIEISVNGEKQYRYTLIGEGYLSQNSASEIFGIGDATVIDYVKVNWLSGTEDIFYNVSPNQNLKIVEGSSLSIEESNTSEIKLFPIPTTEILNIESSLPIEEVMVYNLLGEVNISAYMNKNEISLDVTSLEPGIYFLRLSLNSSQEIIKFIKK